jgi:hypothetical protein
MPLDARGSTTSLLPTPDVLFRLELLGATVSCRVTKPAIDRWTQKHLLGHDVAPGLRRVAKDVLDPLLRQARARPGERWDAWFGADAVALMIDDG